MSFKKHDHQSIFFPEENFSKDEYQVIDRFLQTEWERRVNCHLSSDKTHGGSGQYDPNCTPTSIPNLSYLIDIAERGKNGESVSSTQRMKNANIYQEEYEEGEHNP